MASSGDAALATTVADVARPLRGAPVDLDPLLRLVGEARCVLIGEATHGTHDFYRLRAQLTKRLILEKGFAAIAVEADFADACRVHGFVHGLGPDAGAIGALVDFRRFPGWMWRNADVLDFVGWLRAHNEDASPAGKVGFHGLDLFGLHASLAAMLRALDRVDPRAAQRARERFACFDRPSAGVSVSGEEASLGLASARVHEVAEQLRELQRERAKNAERGRIVPEDERFFAERSVHAGAQAEEYYRTMLAGRVASWNLREAHMATTLDALFTHLERGREHAKIVVWAHNSHVGDARATEMSALGQLSLGQLVRDRYRDDAILIGLTTYAGTVTAASSWGGPAERKEVRPALWGSYEDLFHRTAIPRFSLSMRELEAVTDALNRPRLERSMGAVYSPRTERASHYFAASLPSQFDAVVHFDRTRALESLDRGIDWPLTAAPAAFSRGF